MRQCSPKRLVSRVCLCLLFMAGIARPAAAQLTWNLGTWSLGQVEADNLPPGGPWTVVDPTTLPPGTALRADGPPWAPDMQSVSGVATTPGPYTFILSHGATTYSTTIRITALTIKDNFQLADGFVGHPYSYGLTALNNVGTVTWTPSAPTGTACFGNPWPSGITINSSTGVISGTPTVAGFYPVTLQVNDGVDTLCRGENLVIYDIAVSSAGPRADILPNATQSVLYSTTVTATGGAGPYHFTSSFLPNGLVLDSDGTIHGTPNTGPNKYSLSITATDSHGLSRIQAMALTVIGAPPTLPAISPQGFGNRWDDCTLGWPCSRGISVQSGGTAPFTWSAVLPPGLSIRTAGGEVTPFYTPGDGEIWGVVGAAGDYPITVTVTDATGASATNTFALHVSELVQTDFFQPGAFYGNFYTSRMRVIGGDTNGSTTYAISQTAGQLPAGLTLDNAVFVSNGGWADVTGTPGENGSFSVEYTYTDTGGHSLRFSNFLSIGSQTATININSFYDLGTITQSVPYSNQLQACCLPSPPGISWTVDAGSPPPGLTLSPSGNLSGTPTVSGTFTFLVHAYDATNATNQFVVRQFKIVVSPVGFNGSTVLPYGNVTVQYPTVGGAGVSLGPVTVVGGGTPSFALASGSYLPPGLTLSTGGILSGVPATSGQFTFTVSISAPGNPALLRTFSVSIYPSGVNPPLSFNFGPNIGTFSLGQLTSQILSASGGTPFTSGAPYHFSLTSGAASDSFGVRVQDGPPLPTFFSPSALAGYLGVITSPGSYGSSIRATDSLGNTFDRPFTFTVSSLAILSQTSLPKATVGTPYSFTLTASGGTGAYSWSIAPGSSLPQNFTLNAVTGLISTPVSNPVSGGTFNTNIALTDLNTQERVTVNFTLGINAYAITTAALLPRGTVNASYNLGAGVTFSTSGCGGSCTWSIVSGSVPSGLQLSSAGVLSGTPNGTTNASFTLQVSGSNGNVSKVFSLQVMASTPQPLSITTSSPLGDTTIGNSVSNGLFAQGGTPAYTWSLVSGSLPLGVSLVGPSETLSSTLNPGIAYLAGRPQQPGTFNFTLRVTDGVGAHVDQAFTWHVSELSFQYSNLPLSSGTLTYNVQYHQALLVIGGTAHYSWSSLDPMPPGLTLDPATGVIDGTPSNTGNFSVRIRVTDDFSPTSHVIVGNVSFNITGPTPTLVNFGAGANLGVIQQGFGFTRDLTPSGGTGPYTITALTPLPPGFAIETGNSILANVSGSYILAGTPLAAGTFTFTLQAADSATPTHNIGVRTFTLVVSPVTIFTNGFTSNSGQLALPDASVAQAYSQQMTAWNNAGTTNWAVAGGSSLPSGLTLAADGRLSGAPASAGNFSFALTASSSTGEVVSNTFSLHVSGIRIDESQILPPAIVGITYSHQIVATGGGTKTWSAPQGVPNGFTLLSDGTVTGTPGTSSSSSFPVTVSDGTTTLTRRFTLVVSFSNPGVISFPQLQTTMTDAAVGQNYAFSLNPGGGVPPYSWTAASGSLPAGLSLVPVSTFGTPIPTGFVPGTTLIAGAPTTAGTFSFDLLLSDAAGTQTRRTFTLHVASISVLSGNLKNIITGVAYSQQLTAVGGAAPYTFSMTPLNATTDMLPPGITFDPSGPTAGLLHGTTNSAGSTGSYGFVLHVVDNAGVTFSRSYSLTAATSDGLRINSTNPQDRPVGTNFGESNFFASNLNGGGGPFTWSVLDPAHLPPGMQVTSNGTLAGVSSATGTYKFTISATETPTSHTANQLVTMHVGAQIVSPPRQLTGQLPFAEIGMPFSTALKAAGGVAPYTFTESPFAPLPSWLTLSAAGVLSGTAPPESVGAYSVLPVITDAAGNAAATTGVPLIVVAAGSAPTIISTPGSAFVPPGSVGVPFNVPLDGDAMQLLFRGGKAPYSWSVTAGSLPPGVTLLPGSNGQPSYLAGIPTLAGDYDVSLTVHDALVPSQALTVPVQISISDLAVTPDTLGPPFVGTPYSVSFTPSGGTPPYAFELADGSDVPPGLTLTGGGLLSGTPAYAGNFLVFMQVTDNVGRMMFKAFRVTVDSAAGESPALAIAPASVQMNYVIGSPAPSGVPLSIGTTSGSASFTAGVMGIPGGSLSAGAGTTPGSTSLNIDVTSLAAGTYVGIIGAKAAQSANLIDSVPVILTVQPACSYSLSPSSGSALNTGGTGSFGVGTSSVCSWTAVASDPWITVTSGASGTDSGTVSYTVAANPGSSPRNGSINVSGQLYAITQFGTTCSFAINPGSISATSAGGSALIGITASDSICTWSASGLGATPLAGTGSGSVTVTVPVNTSTVARTLTASIAGQTFSVNQTGTACSVSLDAYSVSSPAAGGSGTVAVAASGCGYSTVPGPSWISVISGGSGSDSGTLVYSVDPNSTTTPRSGTLTVGGQTLHIAQDGLACSVTVDTSGLGSPFGSGGGSGSVGIITNAPSCAWTASSAQTWAGVAPGSGTGSATVFVTVGGNGTLAPRSTTLTIGGQSVGVSQSELACTFNLLSASGSVPASGGAGSAGVSAPAACGWTAASDNPDWLSITSSGSSGSGDVQFVASPNLSASPRSGSLTIASQTYTASQAGAQCAYTLSAAGNSISFGGGNGSFLVTTATGGCTPTAVSYASWITAGTSFSGTSGSVSYSVAPNPSTVPRTGAIQVGDQIFTITELGGTCGWSLNSYGALFNQGGGSGSLFGSPSAASCALTVGADLPSIVTLGALTGPVFSISTQNYSVSPFTSLTIAVRYAHISFGGQVFTVKQTSW
jgi:large repetitive protein